MKVTNYQQNIVRREMETAKIEESRSRQETTALPGLREIVRPSNPTANALEMNLLGQMVQSLLQSSLNESPNLEGMLMAALDTIAQQDPANSTVPSNGNVDTQMAMKATQLHQQVSNNDASKVSMNQADQTTLDIAKKLAEEMKKPSEGQKPANLKDILTFGVQSANQRKELQEKAIALLEQAKTPEEAKQISEQFGGPDFKNQIVDNQLKDRLTQVAQKNNMPGLGFTQSAEQLAKNAETIEKADGDKTVELSKDTELLRNATPDQKMKMINELGKGFDGHDRQTNIQSDEIR